MDLDVELLRLILIFLAAAERSPPEPIFVEIDGMAAQSGYPAADVLDALSLMREKDFIEGPGAYGADQYIFRRLTRKGRTLCEAVRDPKDWARAKALYLSAARDGGAF